MAALFLYGLLSGPEKPPQAVAASAPDAFKVLGEWALSSYESIRLVHVPDTGTQLPLGLRCMIYVNEKIRQSVVQCDDDMPRGGKPQPPAD